MAKRMMFQAIQTKWLGPTTVRGSRVKAWCEADSITLPWNHSLDGDENHAAAAEKLAARLGWTGPFYGSLVGGALPHNAGYAFVFTQESAQ